IPVRWIDQVLGVALETMPQPLPDEEAPKDGVAAPVVGAPVAKSDVSESIKH
ncbi:MAG: hypothetical protein H7276_13245, partial [Caulobacter sp.]|nr:hypothetical protein [Vitreoscilla sp.]